MKYFFILVCVLHFTIFAQRVCIYSGSEGGVGHSQHNLQMISSFRGLVQSMLEGIKLEKEMIDLLVNSQGNETTYSSTELEDLVSKLKQTIRVLSGEVALRSDQLQKILLLLDNLKTKEIAYGVALENELKKFCS